MALILIVDDEQDLAELVDFNLKAAGLSTAVAHTGEAAWALAQQKKPDLVLLDLMLPDISGREVCRRLKADPNLKEVPVVMLTARGDESDRVSGFEVGADDYVTKPFSVRELVLRLKAILRRATPQTGEVSPRLELGLLSLDLGAHRCFVEGGEVELTALEFKLLQHLMSRAGRVQSREQLLSDVWGMSNPLETRTVDTHVMRLRDKLGRAREQVETVRGVGYRLADEMRA